MNHIAIIRDLKSENHVSMERYADELLTMAKPAHGWTAADYVLGESVHSKDTTLQDRLNRYRRRYIDYPRYASTIKADIYHIADHSSAYLLRRLPANRTVVTCHDLMRLTHDEWSQASFSTPTHMAFRMLFRYSVSHLKDAAKVIAVSNKTKSDILRLNLAKESNVDVIPPPLSPVFSYKKTAKRPETRARLGLEDEHIAILHVGSHSAYKNIETVIDVLAELRARGKPAIVIRVGRKFPAALDARAEDLGVQKWVWQLGQVDDVELSFIYGACDMLLFPSIKEGFGWPVVEAMASGLPVVASNVEAISQSLSGSGLQLDPRNVAGLASGVELLCAHSNYRKELIDSALERARDFSREAVGELVRRVYASVYEGSEERV